MRRIPTGAKVVVPVVEAMVEECLALVQALAQLRQLEKTAHSLVHNLKPADRADPQLEWQAQLQTARAPRWAPARGHEEAPAARLRQEAC